jgi:hypothetical protein
MVRVTLCTDPKVTCKDRWTFILLQAENGDYRIQELQIGGDQGCPGHPQTIAALLQGRMIGEIDLEALDDAACSRDQSCGQTLAVLIRELKNSLSLVTERT